MRHQIRWTQEKIAARLRALSSFVYRKRSQISPFSMLELENTGVPDLEDIPEGPEHWKALPPHTYWGKPRMNFVLRSTFSVPETWRADLPLALHLPLGEAGDFSHPEALVYLDGEAYAACDRHHHEVFLPDWVRDGPEHELLLHGWTGLGGSIQGDPTQQLKMGACEVVQIHPPTRELVALTRVALGLVRVLTDDNPVRHHLLTALNQAYQILDLNLPPGEAFYQGVSQALQVLRAGVQKAGEPLEVDITAAGHAHIDVAWLWTLAQTRQKVRRTFHNMIRFLEQYPDFHFTQSQPQLYEYLRKDAPDLFQKIQNWVKKGRWEPIGGMWVEADCNITGGESLVRQFLLGRRFFEEHFGAEAESPVLWLPDVFGYAWNLPQLIKEAGLEYFFTIKIGWNQYNRLPHDSFWWQGLDGTRVLTHFSTTKNPADPHAATYNSDASPEQVLGTWLNFQDKDYGPPGQVPPLLMSYGWGDGGGGATPQMIENLREMEDFPGSPRVRMGKVIDFFRDLEGTAEGLPVWNGELYLEYHRGTYTTQAKTKRANRNMEFALHDAEFVASWASVLDASYSYPHQALDQAWKLLCLNQFHDILPGSSIGEVYQEAAAQYETIQDICHTIREEALGTIAAVLETDFLLVNPTSFERCEPIALGEKVALSSGPLPAYGLKTGLERVQPEVLNCSPRVLENQYLRVELNPAGDITRIYDKRVDREVLAPGEMGNQFQAFEDRPLDWEAWDIDIFYDDRMWLPEPAHSVEVVREGPPEAQLEIRRRIRSSSIRQVITLRHDNPRIDFLTEIDWRERKTLLKVAFPVRVLSPKATYEIQWGNVERPTHRNTSWDWARFETAAQKWVDLSEGDYGVSLLNDCKYGHDIRDHTMRLTLLKGAEMPDPQADLGTHRFTYSLLPHPGSWGRETIKEAYALNDPLLVYQRDSTPTPPARDNRTGTFVSVDRPELVIETVKRAEDDRGIIVRFYETGRTRGPFQLQTGFPVREAWRTTILEEDQTPLPARGYQVQGTAKPFEIITVRLIPAEDHKSDGR
jgi:alpha-mannosidase